MDSREKKERSEEKRVGWTEERTEPKKWKAGESEEENLTRKKL